MDNGSSNRKERRELIAHLMRRAGFGAASTEIDEHGRIYVCDWGNERIQVLDSDGCYICY